MSNVAAFLYPLGPADVTCYASTTYSFSEKSVDHGIRFAHLSLPRNMHEAQGSEVELTLSRRRVDEWVKLDFPRRNRFAEGLF